MQKRYEMNGIRAEPPHTFSLPLSIPVIVVVVASSLVILFRIGTN